MVQILEKKINKVFDYIVKGKAHNSIYINGYIKKDSYYELHITNLKDKDTVILINIEDFYRCKNHFWCISMIGRECHKQEFIYFSQNKIKHSLNRYILDTDTKDRIIFKNRDCLDFRKENLYITNKGETLLYIVSKDGKIGDDLPNGITQNCQKTGYFLHHKDIYSRKAIYFGIKEYGTMENCLIQAMRYREEIMNKKMQ